MEFARLENEFYADPDLRVGVFTSAKPDVFIQHFDVSILVNMGENLAKQAAQAPPPQRRVGFRRDSKPIIAAINANLAGGGRRPVCCHCGTHNPVMPVTRLSKPEGTQAVG